MGIVVANYDGKCSKCQVGIKKGEKLFLDKDKKRLCSKCWPADAKEKKPWTPTRLDLPTEVALEAMKGILIRHPALKAQELALLSWNVSDRFVAERTLRGIK